MYDQAYALKSALRVERWYDHCVVQICIGVGQSVVERTVNRPYEDSPTPKLAAKRSAYYSFYIQFRFSSDSD
ncbi:hypothetical protein VN97_g10153 [Penicillium thymicola]|uniref:Uncharacterized protein n=1 Tax=Penicillium thymicola TaxID=293382 RepID=A0AAI9TAN0_PENTH|nr:hypothetical protein VN97_g10153 [Penicillium thymicola]